MAVAFRFDNKLIKQPGAYSVIKSGVNNPPLSLSFGNVLIVDTGSGAGFGGGSGIAGVNAKNKKAIYEFDSIDEFRSFVQGGLWWYLAEALYRPGVAGVPGMSKLYFTRACATTPSTLQLDFVGGGANGGSLTIQTLDEGLIANTVTDGSLAVASLTIAAVGAVGETIDILVDEGAGAVSIGSYDSLGTETPSEAATAVAAAITVAANKYTATAEGGVISISASQEDGDEANAFILSVNGVGDWDASVTTQFTGGVDFTKVVTGPGARIISGTENPNKWKLQFVVGSYKGTHADGYAYDFIKQEDAPETIIVESAEFDNVQEIIDWIGTNQTFAKKFKLTASTVTGTGVVDATDISNNSGILHFTGGTETYSSAHLDTALDNATELDFSFMLGDKWGADVQHANNIKLQAFLAEEAKFGEFLFVGAGKTEDQYEGTATSSVETAVFYNNAKTLVVHGGVITNAPTTTLQREHDSIYHAALCLGRIAGLAPQVPGTFKSLNIQGVIHELSEKQKNRSLDKGLMVTYYDTDFQEFVILQAISSIQRNQFLVNSDATSHELQIMRIAHQMNKELIVNAKLQLLSQQEGVNRNTLSVEDVKSWVEGYLDRRTATPTADNLIISSKDVVVTIEQDAYKITYGFVPNYPVNKLFFTGFMLEQ